MHGSFLNRPNESKRTTCTMQVKACQIQEGGGVEQQNLEIQLFTNRNKNNFPESLTILQKASS